MSDGNNVPEDLKPLSEHLDDFEKAHEDEGGSAEQVKLVTGRVRRILEGCGFLFPPDLCPWPSRATWPSSGGTASPNRRTCTPSGPSSN